MTPFVFDGRQAIARAVTTSRVVEHLDVVEYITSGDFPRRIDRALEPLEEAFGNGVVVAVTSTSQANFQVIGLQKALPVRAAELAALV